LALAKRSVESYGNVFVEARVSAGRFGNKGATTEKVDGARAIRPVRARPSSSSRVLKICPAKMKTYVIPTLKTCSAPV
jgi:hypothetical protein